MNSDKLNYNYMYVDTKTFKNIFYSLLNPFFSAVLPLLERSLVSHLKNDKRLVIHSKDTDGHNIDKD